MEQKLGSHPNIQPGSIDKSRVLEVIPLRILAPVFPGSADFTSASTPQHSPLMCVPPAGPFPSGVQPFYPFFVPNGSQQTTRGSHHQPENLGFESSVPAPVTLSSHRTPARPEKVVGRPKKASKAAVEDVGYTESQNQADELDDTVAVTNSGKRKYRSRMRRDENGEDAVVNSLVSSYLTLFKLTELNDSRRFTGDKDTVATVLFAYDLIRRRLSQIEESKDPSPGATRRPDLKTCSLMMEKGARTNQAKRIGRIPGVEIGDIFFFRTEICIVGLHSQSIAGIDYMGVTSTVVEESLALSIVSAGCYGDDGDDSNVIIYSGQGGGVQRKDGQRSDQKLERGNLALENSMKRGNEIRVLRGLKDAAVPTGKVYIYDGLYKIEESWVEKNKTECNVFKYKIVRFPGQREAFSLWKAIQQWRDGTIARPGMILPDLASGGEMQPVVLVNDADGDRGPTRFTYTRGLRYSYSQPFSTSNPSTRCLCSGGCQPGDTTCPCIQRNDGYLPYSSIGVLLTDNTVIYECGPNCGCPPSCRNRISQTGVRVRLEVFKTTNRGWGLRSWDPIRSSGFICEYAGDVINGADSRYGDDEFVFDSTRGPLGPLDDDSSGGEKSPFPLVISSKHNGNVARFMNHSCSPNVYWQPVLYESNSDVYLRIAFFATRHIPPLQELTFDYGMVRGESGKRKCFCGSVKCRAYFFG